MNTYQNKENLLYEPVILFEIKPFVLCTLWNALVWSSLWDISTCFVSFTKADKDIDIEGSVFCTVTYHCRYHRYPYVLMFH